MQDKGILLTTYDIVRNNVKSLCGDQYFLDRDEELTWDYIILDEVLLDYYLTVSNVNAWQLSFCFN